MNNQIRINDDELDMILSALYLQIDKLSLDRSYKDMKADYEVLKNRLLNIQIRREKNNGKRT